MLNPEPRPLATAKPWTGKTPEGVPDLQGYWTNNSYTPLQRDANMTKEFFTKEELVADEKRRAAQQEEQTVPGTTADVHYDFTQFALDRSQTRLTGNLRTSIIVDPPNGRLPARVGADAGAAGAAGGRGGGGGAEVPVAAPAAVRHLQPVLEEARVVVLPLHPLAVPRWCRWWRQRWWWWQYANTTRSKTSRSDRGASGRRAPHRS